MRPEDEPEAWEGAPQAAPPDPTAPSNSPPWVGRRPMTPARHAGTAVTVAVAGAGVAAVVFQDPTLERFLQFVAGAGLLAVLMWLRWLTSGGAH